MISTNQKNIIRQVLIFTSFIIILLILWNTYIFFQKFKEEERTKMEIWAAAQAEFIQTKDLDRELGVLSLEVLRTNNSTPMILLSTDGVASSKNLNGNNNDENQEYLQKKIVQFKKENLPIKISYQNEQYGTLYYGNSDVLRKLKFYPIALILIILLFSSLVFLFFSASRVSEQNKLWAGMAKETAHQIGTPLSSLLGWVEILKMENIDVSITSEIEKDIDRLQTITERFSKIGSTPSLKKEGIIEETKKTFEYLKLRSSKLVKFNFKAPEKEVYSEINLQLFSWTIENLLKNAIDAMKGRGNLNVEILSDTKEVKINVIDSGKGISKNNYKKIFNPGYTTKKRGWGLGLSLVRRIIEDYHKGKVKVLDSKIGKGTTMQIILKLAK